MTNGDVQKWPAHAQADLHYARLGQKDAEAREDLIAFHAQQAIEFSGWRLARHFSGFLGHSTMVWLNA